MDEIKDLVKGVFEKITSQQTNQHEKLEQLWKKNLDDKYLRHTKLQGMKEGNISVCVDSPAWLYEMNLKKKDLLAKLKLEFPQAREIYFRIGKI